MSCEEAQNPLLPHPFNTGLSAIPRWVCRGAGPGHLFTFCMLSTHLSPGCAHHGWHAKARTLFPPVAAGRIGRAVMALRFCSECCSRAGRGDAAPAVFTQRPAAPFRNGRVFLFFSFPFAPPPRQTGSCVCDCGCAISWRLLPGARRTDTGGRGATSPNRVRGVAFLPDVQQAFAHQFCAACTWVGVRAYARARVCVSTCTCEEAGKMHYFNANC